jgi:diadenosine tetraphosphatase ApaH/serine/threonine PP2A family protein phosphatase
VSATSPVAILSDIHGNRPALDAALRSAREAGAESWWCLGDLVGYGADPAHCIAVTMRDSERCIAGNHDLGAGGRVALEEFSDDARAALEWTRRALGPADRASLEGLSPEDTGGAVPIFHGSPRDPVWEYILTAQQARAALEDRRVALTLVGHTHVPFAWRLTTGGALESLGVPPGGRLDLGEGRWLVNPGAVGQPRDGDPRAAWALYDPEEGTIEFRRTPYDVAAAQRAILDAGLPASLAHRLAEGR